MKKTEIQKAVTGILQAASNLKTSSTPDDSERFSAGESEVEVLLVDFDQVALLRWVADQRGMEPDTLLREIIQHALEATPENPSDG